MAVLYKYRIWCVTDSQFEYVTQDSNDPAPEVCPTNGSHQVDSVGIVIVEKKETVDYNYSESDSSTTNSRSWQTKVTLTFNAEAADYDVTWYAEVRTTDTGTRVRSRVRSDGTTIGETDWIPDADGGSGWGPISGFKKVTLTAGSKTIELQYRTKTSGKSVKIRNARIKAEKLK